MSILERTGSPEMSNVNTVNVIWARGSQHARLTSDSQVVCSLDITVGCKNMDELSVNVCANGAKTHTQNQQTVVAVSILNKWLLDIVCNNNESSSSDEDDEVFIVLNKLQNNLKPRQREIPRCKEYFENIVPRYLPSEFQTHFRMSKAAFEMLCNVLIPQIQGDNHTGRPYKQLEKQILATIWVLSTPDSYRSIGTQFDMGKSSLSDAFIRIVKGLTRLASTVIKWPAQENKARIMHQFRRFAGMRDIIGAVDGTYVPIKAPQRHPEVYITRKCFYAITLQGIAEPSLRFTDVFVGYPGSVSDNRIFRNSPIVANINANREHYFENNEVIIGDKAYPLLEWCIPPYIEHNRLTPVQRHFNTVHAQTRQVVERSFALLFGRFRRLKMLDMNRQDWIPDTVLAACVLHNICLNHEDSFMEEYIQEGQQFLDAHRNPHDEVFPEAARQAARDRRDHIATSLFNARRNGQME